MVADDIFISPFRVGSVGAQAMVFERIARHKFPFTADLRTEGFAQKQAAALAQQNLGAELFGIPALSYQRGQGFVLLGIVGIADQVSAFMRIPL